MVDSLALLSGIDIPAPELQLVIHQPIVEDIAFMEEDKFFMAVQYICLEKEQLIEDQNVSSSLNNFQVLMKVLEQTETPEKKFALVTLLSIIFPSYKAMITPKSIILTNLDTKETKLIDENNFEFLQSYLRQVFCVSSIFQGDKVIYNPQGENAKRIADKIMKNRKKIAELKASNGKKESVLAKYLSILAVGLHIPFVELRKLTLYQLFDLIERFNLFTEWDIDLRVRLAGGEPKKEAENWMKNIH